MTALIALMLVAGEATPPPVVEAPPPAEEADPEVKVRPDAPGPEEDPEWDLSAQLGVSTIQTLNGVLIGVAACGALSCYVASNGQLPVAFALAGAGAGLTFSIMDRDLSRGWGRASLIDSATVLGGLLGIALAARPEIAGRSPLLAYATVLGTDLLLTGGAAWLAHHVPPPRPEAIWLADTFGLWGLAMGSGVAGIFRRSDIAPFLIGGALTGVAAGAMMGLSAQQLDIWRVLLANGCAFLGALVLGGGLQLLEAVMATPSRPFDPAVPSAGVAAGIAGGFLLGFVFSEER